MSKIVISEPPAQAGPAKGPEEVICKLRPSMWRNQPFTFLLYVVLVLSPAITAIVANIYGLNAKTLAMIAAIPCAFACLMLLGWKMRCRSTELTITTRRSILRNGIFSRYTTEVRHCDVRNIQVSQSFWQRLCGVGRICISSEMEDDHDILVDGLPHPDHIAETMRKLQ
jgi:uncharacterized membrane protein YdbT with pleckstrin-like domain